MDWMKVPTDELLLPTRKNWEILALLKYQALYTQLEYEPNDTQMKRIFTKKEMDFVKNNRQVVEKIIKKDIESAEKNRKSSKVSYERKNEKLKENKELEKNLQADCKNNTPPEKIREDKTIKREIEKAPQASPRPLLPRQNGLSRRRLRKSASIAKNGETVLTLNASWIFTLRRAGGSAKTR